MIGLTILVLLLILAVVAELAARWWIRHRGEYYVLTPGLRIRLSPDPVVFPTLERVVRFEINSEGERGDEVPRDTHGLYRILVSGGSQPEGYFLDQDTTWPGAVHRLLARPESLRELGASRVHVGCVARSGVGSEALDLIFARMLPRYPRLQMIVAIVGVTDVLRWFEQNTPTTPTTVGVKDVFRCHPEGPFGWKPGTLALVELGRRVRRRWLRPIDVQKGAGRWIGDARAMRARATTVYETTPDPSAMLDQFEQNLRRLLQRAQAHADRVLVVRQPWMNKALSPEEAAIMWHGGIGQAWREKVTTYYSFDAFSRVMSLVDARAASVARSLGIEQLDLMPLHEQSVRTYYDCFHLTPAGASQVAEAVADAIVRMHRRPSVPAAPRIHVRATRRRETLHAS